MKEKILTAMTFKELQEFNSKQKYPWNLELGSGYFYYYNPIYMDKKGGGIIYSNTEYNEFIEELLKRNCFKYAKDSIEFDNKYLKDCGDYVEIGYNYEEEGDKSIKYIKTQKK
jgi:hypothetical protein